MRKTLFCASMLALSLSFTRVALADPSSPIGAPQPIPSMQISKELALTPDQEVRFKAIQEQLHSKLASLKSEYHSINDEIYSVTKDSSLDDSKLNALIEKKKEMVGIIIKDKAILLHKLYTILTPAQKIKLDELIKKREIMHSQSDMPIQQS